MRRAGPSVFINRFKTLDLARVNQHSPSHLHLPTRPMSLLSFPLPPTPTPSPVPSLLQTSILSLPSTNTSFIPVDVRFLTKAKDDVGGGSIVTPAGLPQNIIQKGMVVALIPAAAEGTRPFCGQLTEIVAGTTQWIMFLLRAASGEDCFLLVPRQYARIGWRDTLRILFTPSRWLNTFPPHLAVFHPQPISFTVAVRILCPLAHTAS